MKIVMFVFGNIGTNCYIVFDEKTKNAFCVDIADNASSAYFDFIDKEQLNIKYMLLTHAHHDHVLSAKEFKRRYEQTKFVMSKTDYENILNGKINAVSAENFIVPDIFVEDNSQITFQNDIIKVIATPGHTSGSVCYLFADNLFCGDTVFKGSIGRTDLPTGSTEEIFKSIQKIKQFHHLNLFPGHMEVTDLTSEKKYNPYFNYEFNTK